jgi:hypothetical protein
MVQPSGRSRGAQHHRSRFGGNATVDRSAAHSLTLWRSRSQCRSRSSDLVLVQQLRADVVDCVITGTAAASSRDFKRHFPGDPTDGTTFSFGDRRPRRGGRRKNQIVSGRRERQPSVARGLQYSVSLANLPSPGRRSGSRDLTLADSPTPLAASPRCASFRNGSSPQ